MRTDALTKFLLAVIALALAIIAARPFVTPEPARAADVEGLPNLWIEPGSTNLRAPDGSRNVIGKVVVDLNTGNVWGFPTLTNAPYPVDTTRTTPPVSRPIYLGRYDFAAIREGAR
ncbi:MAG: hypothetical protein L0Z53_13705 [Acidobacteriales bacterium]|nr:hypothetical protein [Terriglobales bacterium]